MLGCKVSLVVCQVKNYLHLSEIAPSGEKLEFSWFSDSSFSSGRYVLSARYETQRTCRNQDESKFRHYHLARKNILTAHEVA